MGEVGSDWLLLLLLLVVVVLRLSTLPRTFHRPPANKNNIISKTHLFGEQRKQRYAWTCRKWPHGNLGTSWTDNGAYELELVLLVAGLALLGARLAVSEGGDGA